MTGRNNTQDLAQRERLVHAFESFGHILTTNQRQIFHLHYIEDLSLAEIAAIVATTRSSVYDALQKAHRRLVPLLDGLD